MRKSISKIICMLVAIMLSAAWMTACKEDKIDVKLTLDQKEITLTEHGTAVVRLTATIEGTTELPVWETSDAKVVTFRLSGDSLIATLKAVSHGEATVMVSVGGKTESCKVKVSQSDTLEIHNPYISLNVGTSEKINYTASAASASFFSYNQDVASVDSSGNITAVGRGSAVIKVTAGMAEDYVSVIVAEPSLELNKNSLQMVIGAKETLQAAVIPVGSKVAYKSDDEKVATVDSDGMVTAIGAGEATITASHSTASDTCKVVVKEEVLLVSILKGAEVITSAHLDVIQTLQLSAKVFSVRNQEYLADAKVTWSVVEQDSDLITISADGLVTSGSQYGTVTVRATSVDDSQFYTDCEVTVQDFYEGWVKISTKEEFDEVMLNPDNFAKNIYLTADIDLEGKEYGIMMDLPFDPDNASPGNAGYEGTFEGRGHKIFNFTVDQMFTGISKIGMIKDIEIVADVKVSNHRGIFGNGMEGSIENCLFDLTIRSAQDWGAALATYNRGHVVNSFIYLSQKSSSQNFFATFTQPNPGNAPTASATNVFYCTREGNVKTNGGMSGGTAKTEAQLKQLATYDDTWDRSIWLMEDGALPTLIEQ